MLDGILEENEFHFFGRVEVEVVEIILHDGFDLVGDICQIVVNTVRLFSSDFEEVAENDWLAHEALSVYLLSEMLPGHFRQHLVEILFVIRI